MSHKNKRLFFCKTALAVLVFGGFQLSDSQAMDAICDPHELAREAEQMHRELEQERLEKNQELLTACQKEYSETRERLQKTHDYFLELYKEPRNENGRIMNWDSRGDEKDVDTTVEAHLAVKFLGGALFVLPYEASSDFNLAQKHLKDIKDIKRIWENCRKIDYGRWPRNAFIPE